MRPVVEFVHPVSEFAEALTVWWAVGGGDGLVQLRLRSWPETLATKVP